MPKYRKRPVVVEAEQYRGEPCRGVCVDPHRDRFGVGGHPTPHVHTIHAGQTAFVVVGDWIIAEPDGEHFYPCKADIFAASYEAAGA